jgi:hypothetical protein
MPQPPSAPTIYLGLTFTDTPLPQPRRQSVDEHFLDYDGLLAYLEALYALGAPGTNRAPLRTEEYRQVVELHRREADRKPFYAASLDADRFATAEDLLSRRDELLECGYRLDRPATDATPERLRVLHELEELLLDPHRELSLLAGRPERLNALLAALATARHPRLTVYLNEPRPLLPPGLRRLLDRLEQGGDRIIATADPEPPTGDSDLETWQSRLHGLLGDLPPGDDSPAARGDGSLVVLRAERETHLAAYLARMARENPDWRPAILMNNPNQTLDNAFVTEGLPSMGIPSLSLARPSLQVLKLVTAFLWEPVEVQRIMEFVSLVTKPLDPLLGQRLAIHLADTPGLFGARWTFTVEESFRRIADKKNGRKRARRAREQYDFWFRRRRYPRDGRVPKGDVRSLFVFLNNWAQEAYEEEKEQTGLLVLMAQSERATELLDVLPETELSLLDVERVVRTIYQPAPQQFSPREQQSFPTAFAPASFARLPENEQGELDRLIWWDFVAQDPNYFFSRYYPEELAYLAQQSLAPLLPAQQNQLLIWQSLRPLLHCRKQVILCLPRRVDGTEREAHPLMGDLEATFREDSLNKLTVDIDETGQSADVLNELVLPRFLDVPLRPLSPPAPHLEIARPEAIQARERETPTALDDLLYYPHKWVFRHQLQLHPSPILSIASENRLRGNLSHLFIERLLAEIAAAGRTYTQAEVTDWIDEHARDIFRQQGAVLLEYGQEPERVQFLLTMKRSAWTLVNYIQANRWRIRGSEEEVEGTLELNEAQRIVGRADLVLEREGADGRPEVAVVDLKWRGKTVFRDLLRNAADIQLCLYAKFLKTQDIHRVHTAYYILRDGLMLARNELAFEGAEVVPMADDYEVVQRETLSKICQTARWRWNQLQRGTVEVRCRETAPFLEDLYLELPHDELLVMQEHTSPFDDYRSLIGLIR